MLLQVSHLIWFLDMSRQQWLEGVDQSYAVENPSEAQYWLERVGLWLAVDFQIQAPFLFAFAARGSLVNSYLGISFGTIIKWHRCDHDDVMFPSSQAFSQFFRLG